MCIRDSHDWVHNRLILAAGLLDPRERDPVTVEEIPAVAVVLPVEVLEAREMEMEMAAPAVDATGGALRCLLYTSFQTNLRTVITGDRFFNGKPCGPI